MLKDMFEQFIGQGAQCTFYCAGMYWYIYGENRMLAFVEESFPYTPRQIEELIHNDFICIRALNFS